ncbi:venom allergen 5 2-like [Epargyreus clarus]|uniref:venom allergen 5 2-like n=1 Tax=Epargyreus clarus TaxID=520877 RepID=UPI003C30E568
MIYKQTIILIFLTTLTRFTWCNKRVNLSCAQIRAFVDGHNFRRWTVAQGVVLGQPATDDMLYMVWDEELAEKAAQWAENGIFGHNPNRTIGSQRWELVGENVYFSKFLGWGTLANVEVVPNIEEALASWYNEYMDYGFFPFCLGTKKAIGHYTQLVWANTHRVGCGISQKKQTGETFTLFVCNYGPTGNYLGQLPYKPSKYPGSLHWAQEQNIKPYGIACSF